MSGPLATSKTTRRAFLQGGIAAGCAAAGGPWLAPRAAAADASAHTCQVGAYYFGNYHVDPRNEKLHGKGWSEWELLKQARPRFPGHRQPKIPAWGYLDEADPAVMEKKIDAAADHGLDYWIFDWYWYDDGPFLQRCLEEGYLKARNNQRVKFCCMWANHDWMNLHPYTRGEPRKVLYPGKVTPQTFRVVIDHVVGRYFAHPSYWKIGGCPYFSFYHLSELLANFGSVAATRDALDEFRARTRSAGFANLHLNAVVWGRPVLPGEKTPLDPQRLVADLGFDSVTSYVWVHHVPLPRLQTDYEEVQKAYFAYWQQAEQRFSVPYFPNVTMGWDPSPRTNQTTAYGNFGYPYSNTISGNTPQRFQAALAAAKNRLDQQSREPKILNLNAWNEWTEGSYLEPDTVNGLGYLEAVKAVFG